MSLGFNGVDRVLWLRKIPMRLRGTNFCTCSAQFAPSFVSNQMVPNAPKWYEMQQNMSLGSNSLDRERSLQKILTRHRGTNFCINCTSLACFASSLCSSIMVPNAPKWKETHENMSLGSIVWIGSVGFEKF